jgi:hypothetical protein
MVRLARSFKQNWRTGNWRAGELGSWGAGERNRGTTNSRSWQLEAGRLCWKLETGDWKLATGNWRLETGDWKLATEK